jgi:RNA polymerase sigma-70 factor (ECF subfamily)
MLGSRAEAEDIVQDAWLDWAEVDERGVRHPGAYLSHHRDVEALAKVLTEDAVMLADGGGKARALPRPLQGGTRIARTFIGYARLQSSRAWRLERARINGLPGCVIFDDATGQLVQTIALAPSAAEPGRIGALYFQLNPDKLQGVLAALGHSGAIG